LQQEDWIFGLICEIKQMPREKNNNCMKKIVLFVFLITFMLVVIRAQNIKYPTKLHFYNSTRSFNDDAISIGDIDNDGDNDVLALNSNLFYYEWSENNGHGAFTNSHLIKDCMHQYRIKTEN
jgi:hypothetical protein